MSAQLLDYIKTLIPLCDIRKEENLQNLYRNIVLGKTPAGKILFNSGHKNEFTYYLLDGQLTLTDRAGKKTLLSAEDPRCRFPVGYDQSFKYTVSTNTAVHYLKINSQTLDVILTWDQTTTPLLRRPYKSDDDDSKVNWMSKILQLELFQRIPPANIQAMFLRFVSFKAPNGSIIIEQDSEADDYYVIKSGTAAVYRIEAGAPPRKLAELGPGDAFGEEGLVAGIPRNASVIMLEDGELARLSKTDFLELLKSPVVQPVDYAAAMEMIHSGARFIDARTAHEFLHNHLETSLNLPLQSIREKLSDLDPASPYIVYCDTGSRSAAACYILNQQGFTAYLLENGLNMVPSDAIVHPDQNS